MTCAGGRERRWRREIGLAESAIENKVGAGRDGIEDLRHRTTLIRQGQARVLTVGIED